MGIGIVSTNRVNHARVRESTFGVVPTNPQWRTQRVTSSGLNANPVTAISEEIRSDRQIPDLALVGFQTGGDVGGELVMAAHEDILEEAVQGTWTSKPAQLNLASDTPISDLTTTTVTVASGGASFLANMIAILDGFTTAANNRTPKVVASSTATTIVFPASSWTAEAVIPIGASVRVVGFTSAAADITATATGLGSTTLDFTTLSLAVGEWVKVGGSAAGTQFATAANNGWARISAIAATALTFDLKPTGWSVDSGSGKTIWVFMGDYVRNSTTQRSVSYERQYLDMASVGYELLVGLVLDKLSLNFSAQKIITLTETYIGKSASISTTRTSGSTDLAYPDYPIMNASANVAQIYVNGAALPTQNYVMDASIDIANNQRPLYAVGSTGAVGVGNGQFDVTGRTNIYFADSTFFNYVVNNTAVQMNFLVIDANAPKETLIFDMPRVKFSSGAPKVPGKNQNVMIEAEYRAIRDPSLTYTLHIGRYWYTE